MNELVNAVFSHIWVLILFYFFYEKGKLDDEDDL